jgi:hypothetical protein
MAFSIRFLPDSSQDIEHGPIEAAGEIVLGGFRELFLASLSFWTRVQYEAHWREALNRIVTKESPSCLITTMYDPVIANFIWWWPMYREAEEILVQNHLLLLTELKERFDPNNPYRFISEYGNRSEDGEPISEWKVSIGDISTFLEQVGWTL